MSRATALALAAALLAAAVAPAAFAAPQTYIVSFEAPPTAEQIETLAGLTTGTHAFRHLPAAVVVADPLNLELLRSLPGVRAVHVNTPLVKMLRQSTRSLRADRVWNELGYDGAGIGVAVIDTGIDGSHPDLCAAEAFCRDTPVKTVQNVKIFGRQDVLADPVVVLEDQINTDTSSGHGSHVAGIVGGYGVASAHEAGRYRGVAPGARLIGLGTGEAVEAVNVLAAFDWVIEHKDDPRYNIKVINNSYGPGKGTPFDPDDPMQRAIAAAYDAGLTVVFGAGNDGPVTDTLNAFSVNPKAISAAASIKEGHIAFFSSRGVPGSAFWRPTVTATGSNIASARSSTGIYGDVADALAPNPDMVEPPDTLYYASASGTSMASPHVAGVVALMQQAAYDARGVYLTPAQVRNILQNTAVSRDAARGPGGLPDYQAYTMGAGHVDAHAAVQAAAADAQMQDHDDGIVHDVRGFAGSIDLLTTSFETTCPVAEGAVSLDVMAEWSLIANDIDIELYRPDGTLYGSTFLRCAPANEPNGYSSFCTQIANERTTAIAPVAGTWRAVVRASILGVDSIHGLWSVTYPDTHTPPTAQQATQLSLQPGSATGSIAITGFETELTVTVRDAQGHPVANAPLDWSTGGVGSLRLAEPETHADGSARAWAVSSVPGTQAVTAGSASLQAQATISWLGLALPELPLAQSTAGKTSGGGWILDPGKRHFGFWAEYDSAASAPAGELVFDDHAGNRITATSVNRLQISGTAATVKGAARLNDQAGYHFRLDLVDNGSPGRNDSFRLVLTRDLNPLYRYETAGTLGGGNIDVRTD